MYYYYYYQLFSSDLLTQFSAVRETAVSALLKKTVPKSCDLDLIPTSLLFNSSDEIVAVLSHVINKSLLSNTFPTVFKRAVVKPLVKTFTWSKWSPKLQTCVKSAFLFKVVGEGCHVSVTWPSEHKLTLASISVSLPCSSHHWKCAT